jgi:DNA-binding NarL/FixJ family response regulator
MSNHPLKPVNERIRVLIFSKYQIERESLKCLIETNRDLSVAGTSGYAQEMGIVADVPKFDVVVINFSVGDSIEIISDLRTKVPDIRVVVIIDGANLEAQTNALKLGAVGIVQKQQSPKLLLEAIRRTHKGETWLNQVLLNKILQKGTQNGNGTKSLFQNETDSLTVRELEVINMIGEGLKNKDIALRLFISEATVRHHLSSIYGKVGVEDRLNLVIFAYQKGLLRITGDIAGTFGY